jgi:hypothetical protein
VDLRWDQIDFAKGHLHVRRLKGGIHSVHPLQGDELRNFRQLKREQDPESAFIFNHRARRANDALKCRQDDRNCCC